MRDLTYNEKIAYYEIQLKILEIFTNELKKEGIDITENDKGDS